MGRLGRTRRTGLAQNARNATTSASRRSASTVSPLAVCSPSSTRRAARSRSSKATRYTPEAADEPARRGLQPSIRSQDPERILTPTQARRKTRSRNVRARLLGGRARGSRNPHPQRVRGRSPRRSHVPRRKARRRSLRGTRALRLGHRRTQHAYERLQCLGAPGLRPVVRRRSPFARLRRHGVHVAALGAPRKPGITSTRTHSASWPPRNAARVWQ